MQRSFTFDSTPVLPRLRARLLAKYGPQRDPLRFDPLSQLIRAMVGSCTRDEVSFLAFLRLKHHYKSWDRLSRAAPIEIEQLIQPATYAEVKAEQLPQALRMIAARSGNLDLTFLAEWPEEIAMRWLLEIHGVGAKIAATVLNFSTLRKRVLAVDRHLLRVGIRLGLLPPNADYERGYETFMTHIPDGWDADDLYEFHCLMKLHSQRICTHGAPACSHCPLQDLCARRLLPDNRTPPPTVRTPAQSLQPAIS
jgi:endonuclease III